MVANNTTPCFHPNVEMNKKNADASALFIDEGIRPFAKPVVQRASIVFKAVKYPTMNYAVPKKVLAVDDGRLYEEGLEIKTARFGKVHRIYRLIPQEGSTGEEGSAEIYVRSNEKLAVKKLHKRNILHNRERAENPIHEIAALQLLASISPSTTPYVDCFADNETIYLITPYYNAGDLLDLIFLKQKLNESFSLREAKEMFRQLANQVSQIHHMGLVHRDLSLENVLFDRETRQYSIIDYGMAMWLKENETEEDSEEGTQKMMVAEDEMDTFIASNEEKDRFSSSLSSTVSMDSSEDAPVIATSRSPAVGRLYDRFARVSKYITCGKTHYMAPEIWEHERDLSLMYSDIWSLGVIFFMVLMFQAPFASSKQDDLNFNHYLRNGQNLEELMFQLGGEVSFYADKPAEEIKEYQSLVQLINAMLQPKSSSSTDH